MRYIKRFVNHRFHWGDYLLGVWAVMLIDYLGHMGPVAVWQLCLLPVAIVGLWWNER